MAILAIDTASVNCSVLVERVKDSDRCRSVEEIGRGHAERLIPMIGRVLAEAGADYDDLRAIVVTIGPGTFTGIRVGLSAARGFGLALDIPVIGVPVLHAHALKAFRMVSGMDESVLVLLNASRGDVFAERFSRQGSSDWPESLSKGALLENEALNHRLFEAVPDGGESINLAGSGAAAAKPVLEECGRDVRIIHEHAAPDIDSVADLGIRMYQDGMYTSPPDPLYLRKPDAKPQKMAPLFAGHR
ncbi:MAG: tRNA (adenosine(37)-N6)-threonylcarbamoyltransferase complex dimerization subunit type 1 TsaB [Pseudomonadota bacterium]